MFYAYDDVRWFVKYSDDCSHGSQTYMNRSPPSYNFPLILSYKNCKKNTHNSWTYAFHPFFQNLKIFVGFLWFKK